MHAKRPILVTGSHRSGSSWVGKMLALHPSVAYINEPFNIEHTPRVCKAKFEYWFTYICDANESLYSNEIDDCIHFKYPLPTALASSRSAKDIAKLIRDYSYFLQHRIMNKRALMKDPIALFSTEWLATTFNMDVIMLIRHPAAFAGSLKSSRWSHPFSHFLNQPLLMEQHLSRYRKDIEAYSRSEKDYVDQAILLWNLVHHMILQYRKNHDDWTFARHEDLSDNPLGEFAKFYEKLGLDFSHETEQKIMAFSFSSKSSGIKRNSKSNKWSWKERLTEDEIKRVKVKTEEIASSFYSESDWEPPEST